MLNETGDVIAQEGESISLQGAPIPILFDPEHYPELYYDLPQDFKGPYWIIIQE